MIIECPECGGKNQTNKPPEPGRRYRCGKCGAVITFPQTADNQDTLTEVPMERPQPEKQDAAAKVPKDNILPEKKILSKQQGKVTKARDSKVTKRISPSFMVIVAILVIVVIVVFYFMNC